MTRKQFLNDLYHHLYGLTQDQAEQHLTYYAEMLADRMEEGMSEEDAVAGMEDVETIARRIMEEEGLPYTPPEERPVVPPSYPDASRMGGVRVGGRHHGTLLRRGIGESFLLHDPPGYRLDVLHAGDGILFGHALLHAVGQHLGVVGEVLLGLVFVQSVPAQAAVQVIEKLRTCHLRHTPLSTDRPAGSRASLPKIGQSPRSPPG